MTREQDQNERDGDGAAVQGQHGERKRRVLVTGGAGFVGRATVRALVDRGHVAVCLVRDRNRLKLLAEKTAEGRIETVEGDLFDQEALARACAGADAAIHLIGIIAEQRLKGQTFHRVHVEGTQRVINACLAAGVRRFVHMSALGTRPNAVSTYHQTKWAAECRVRDGGLNWTIFRPSVIHGPDGEFVRMLQHLVCRATVPVFGFVPFPVPFVPYFGSGQNRLQPVSVLDVAFCFVAALQIPATIGQTYELGGPEAMTWKELYRICRDTLPGAKTWKPFFGVPVWLAKLKAMTGMKLPIVPRWMRFNVDQVQMSQEDSVCDIEPVERTFGLKLRDFRTELSGYAGDMGR